MQAVENLDSVTILDDSVFIELFEIQDPIEKSRRKVALINRAKQLGVKSGRPGDET